MLLGVIDSQASWTSNHWPLIVLAIWLIIGAIGCSLIWFAVKCFERGKKVAKNERFMKDLTDAEEADRQRKN